MSLDDPNISSARPAIRPLDEAAVNRIAAGEVVERPASAVKELVENALDAGATRVGIDVAQGGKALIRVTDNGCGITAEDLPLALARHATSKIDGSDLVNIRSFGFRGEALASLAAVARVRITSRPFGADGAEIAVSGGTGGTVRPAALGQGTVLEVRDLFFATPARLKFLRTDRAEMQAITEVVKRLAMAEPGVAFTLTDMSEAPGRVVFRADASTGDLFDARRDRLGEVIGRDFTENAVTLDATREGLSLTGLAGLPTYSRGAAVAQFIFVNGRPVRDKLLSGALRAAYRDVMSRDRHPVAALYLSCDPALVDVNVHPAKSEVRFRDPAAARSLIVSGIRQALADVGHQASSTVGAATIGAFAAEPSAPRIYQMDHASRPAMALPARSGLAEPAADWVMPSARIEARPDDGAEARPLGAARAQVHENYIVAQTETGIVLVDQHAAHERLVYERLKRQMAEAGVASQALLIPEIVTVGDGAEVLLEIAGDLARLGLVIEGFGPGTIAVRETPALLGPIEAAPLLRDILDEIADQGGSEAVAARLDAVLSRMACHGSVRSGRRMSADEMNALLREIEATPLAGQCNHGRPTYVELKLADIERLFGRR